MDMVRVYVIENSDVFIVCPNCSADNSITLSRIEFKNTIVLDCTCGNTFSVFLDRRNFYRKLVNLTGLCFSSDDHIEGVIVRILDISMSGICFVKDSGKELVKGEMVRLQFRLRDHDNLIISLAATINIRRDHIGSQFVRLDDHTRKLLGFFLLP